MTHRIEISDALHDEIVEEMSRAEHEHGPLTTHIERVYTLMGEEFGEIARAILEQTRAIRIGDPGVAAIKKREIRAETIQLVALGIHFINQLDRT